MWINTLLYHQIFFTIEFERKLLSRIFQFDQIFKVFISTCPSLPYFFFRWTPEWYPFYRDGNVITRSKLCFKNSDDWCFWKKIWSWPSLRKEVSFKFTKPLPKTYYFRWDQKTQVFGPDSNSPTPPPLIIPFDHTTILLRALHEKRNISVADIASHHQFFY